MQPWADHFDALFAELCAAEKMLVGALSEPLRKVVAPSNHQLIAAQIAKTHHQAEKQPFFAHQ